MLVGNFNWSKKTRYFQTNHNYRFMSIKTDQFFSSDQVGTWRDERKRQHEGGNPHWQGALWRFRAQKMAV